MKFAPILPANVIDLADPYDYHLILPQVCFEYSRYYDYYKSGYRGYKILDNGAAEGKLSETASLLRLGAALTVDEVVVPDVLHNATDTWKLLEEFSDVYTNQPWRTNVMVVAQGSSKDEIVQLACDALGTFDFVTTIGLPRWTVNVLGSYARAEMASLLAREAPRDYEVHFLGASTPVVQEPRTVYNAPKARGMDTSLPTYLGMKGIKIDDFDRELKRPDDFWEASILKEQRDVIRHNLQVYSKWCKGR